MASSLDSDAAAVCCMCGDHGLPRELYRCDLCRIRTQHRYCSDLYPAAAAAGPFRSCNWCLRQGGAVGGGGHSPSPVNKVSAAAGTGTRRRISINGSRGDDHRYGCSRSAFSADPRKPIKKPEMGREERAVQRPEPVLTTLSKETREVVQPGKPRFKVRVRRYKLLAEVIC